MEFDLKNGQEQHPWTAGAVLKKTIRRNKDVIDRRGSITVRRRRLFNLPVVVELMSPREKLESLK